MDVEEAPRNMFLNGLYKKLKWYYFMYDLHTSLYMLESWEKRVFSILFARNHSAALYICIIERFM